MNKERRKEIYGICNRLSELQADQIADQIEEIVYDVEMILADEEYYRDDGIPENMQNGSKYDKADEACENLGNAISELNNISSEHDVQKNHAIISKAIDYLYEAAM